MKTIATILAGALALTGATAVSAATAAEKGEAKLARMLEGRVAGEAERCITAIRSNKVETIDHVGLVYDAGETIYVARVTDPNALRRTDALVLDRLSSGMLCTDDVRFTIDRHQGNITGSVFLSDFVPYRRS